MPMSPLLSFGSNTPAGHILLHYMDALLFCPELLHCPYSVLMCTDSETMCLTSLLPRSPPHSFWLGTLCCTASPALWGAVFMSFIVFSNCDWRFIVRHHAHRCLLYLAWAWHRKPGCHQQEKLLVLAGLQCPEPCGCLPHHACLGWAPHMQPQRLSIPWAERHHAQLSIVALRVNWSRRQSYRKRKGRNHLKILHHVFRQCAIYLKAAHV